MKISVFLISILIILISSFIASATDWSIGNPRGIGYTNYITDEFVITNNNASASTGDISTYDLQSGGMFTSTSIFTGCVSCLYGFVNPIDNTRWGSDEAGNVFYTTSLTPINYSDGFFTAGVSGTCYSLGGNCNNLHRVASLSAATINRKMAFDSNGNVYIADGLTVYRYVKELDYSQQLFYTLVVGTDLLAYTGNACPGAPCVYNVLSIQIDASNNVYILTGSRGNNVATGSMSRIIVDSTKTKIKTELGVFTESAGPGLNAGPVNGGMVLDNENPQSNYTYVFQAGNNSVYIMHNSSSGSVDLGGGALTGITDLGDIGYDNFQVFLSSPSQNLVRSYVTTYEGFAFSQIPTNPDGITGTFTWVNGYGTSITTLTPGAALAYRWTISNELSNYTFFSGWAPNTQTEPGQLRDLTDLTGLGKPAVFLTNSNELAGSTIYGYLLARRINDSSWSLLATPQILTISPAAIGFDSITLDKTYYNLTGDTIQATLTYASGFPYLYQWQLCTRADCADGLFFNQMSLVGTPQTSSMSTDGLEEGNYYAVMMKHLPFLQNQIVASQRFEVRPPVIGVSWDKVTYNLLPKSSVSSCQDSTPSTSYFNEVPGYAGLQKGWFSCNTTSPDANANNSIMRGSLYAKYNGTFYLNNSLGNVWSGNLSNGSGTLIYSLTNSSVTETWTLIGINGTGGEQFYANAEVVPESIFGYSISVSPTVAYNLDTLYFTFTKPIYKGLDYVIVMDAGGVNVVSFSPSATSGTYYIDPNKQYTYGTWTAYWAYGSENPLFDSSTTVVTFTVKNAGRPRQNASVIPDEPGQVGTQTALDLLSVMSVTAFWGFVIWMGIIGTTIKMMVSRGGNVDSHGLMFVGWLSAILLAVIGLFAPYKIYIIVVSTILAAIMFKFLGRDTTVGA